MPADVSPNDLKIDPNVVVLSAKQKRELVQRVLEGRTFARATAMRSFLLHVANNSIVGNFDKLKEQSIGAEALGRKADYDPAVDNIVRVRAHELRDRLEKHFSSDGIDEPVVIIIPRGSYALEFRPREQTSSSASTSAPAETASPIEVDLQAMDQSPLPSSDVSGISVVDSDQGDLQTAPTSSLAPKGPGSIWQTARKWSPFVAFLIATVVLIASIIYLHQGAGNRRAMDSEPSGAIHDFWGQFFASNKELRVVYSDTNFVVWEDLTGNTLNLGQYLSRKYSYFNDEKLGEIAIGRSTSPADLAISAELATLSAGFGAHLTPQFSRDTNSEFFQTGNVVLIGSRRSNPWLEFFEPNLDFVLEQDSKSSAVFRDRFPKNHDKALYAGPSMEHVQGYETEEFTSYGVLALLRACGERRYFVIAEGLNMQATLAVGETVSDPHRLDAFLRSVGHKSGTNVAPFQALIQVTSLPGGYDNPKVIAFRPQPEGACVSR